jgi:hypothetical protein
MTHITSAQDFEDGVLPRELAWIEQRRREVFPNLPPVEGSGAGEARANSAASRADGGKDAETPASLKRLAAKFREAHRVRPFGVALSGGGIRSATFSLGILQGLAEMKLLKYVDYLSTVSGGGYIGSWLHGVIRNRCDGSPERAGEILSPRENPVPDSPDDDPIAFLRKYSNYPAPKPTLFSADVWVLALIWLRNFLLNQLILAPALAALVLALLILGYLQQMREVVLWESVNVALNEIAIGLSSLALLIAIVVAGLNLRGIIQHTLPAKSKTRAQAAAQSADHWSLLIVPLVFFATLVIGGVDLERHGARSVIIPTGAALLLLFGLFQFSGGFVRCYRYLHPDQGPFSRWAAFGHVLWMTPLAAAVSTGLIYASWQLVEGKLVWSQLAFAPTLVCLSLFAGVALLLGLMGTDYPDGAREWISRMGSMIAIVCAAWTGVFLIAVFGPWAFAYALGEYGAIGLTAVGGWALTTAGGVLAGKSASGPSENDGKGKSRLGWLVGIAPTVFMIGYLLAIAFAVHLSLRAVSPARDTAAADAGVFEWFGLVAEDYFDVLAFSPAEAKKARAADKPDAPVEKPTGAAAAMKTAGDYRPQADPKESRWEKIFEPLGALGKAPAGLIAPAPAETKTAPAPAAEPHWHKLGWLLLFFGACVGAAAVASKRININEFSMHHFYKNRLVRCYLGASNSKNRKPNALTGFDPADDFSIASLLPDEENRYFGPYAIVSTALNLNAGSELAQQERKAASFVFTPGFCGFAPSGSKEDQHAVRQSCGRFEAHGYRATPDYSCPAGPNLGTAMAISGAAANPNSGYQTSGPMAFLLTVFDARLGWWLGNPRWKRASRYPGPLFALKYLFVELLGQTTGRTKFVNLSDGGHFDNLGLYELVRRRCRYIIVCDGEQDGDLTFGSLGGAIRKCRADFGVEIDINPDPIRMAGDRSKVHCVVGTIQYPEDETGFAAPLAGNGAGGRRAVGKTRGWILYLKSSLTGDEPTDVIEYRSRFPKFPHESTADQFFSESQFESYRRLGLHVARAAFEGVRRVLKTGAENELLQVFQDLTRKWYTPIPVTAEAASRLADSYSSLMRSLGGNTALEPLVPALLPNLSAGNGSKGGRPPASKETVLFGLEVIQLMQNVYTEFDLQHRANRANPRNAGWMEVFRRWVENDVFYEDIWGIVKDDYHPLFQQFMEDLRDGPVDDVPLRP